MEELDSVFDTAKEAMKKAVIFDLIEIQRDAGFCHWVMYIGGEKVVHVTKGEDMAQKRVNFLESVVGGDKCRINNLEKEAEQRRLKPLPDDQIWTNIDPIIESKSLPCDYHVAEQNCEQYVTAWKYGNGFSVQVDRTMKKMEQIGECVKKATDRAKSISALASLASTK